MHSIIDFLKNLYDPVYMQGLIHSGGVPLIAAIVFAETGLLVGFFLPGDTMLFVAGVAAASVGPSGETWLNIYALVPALIAAAIIGDQCGYFLGNKTGHAIFTREEGFFFKRKHAEKAHAFYLKYGVWAVVLAKFAPVLRTFVPFMAGVGEMPYRKYLSSTPSPSSPGFASSCFPVIYSANARRKISTTSSSASRWSRCSR